MPRLWDAHSFRDWNRQFGPSEWGSSSSSQSSQMETQTLPRHFGRISSSHSIVQSPIFPSDGRRFSTFEPSSLRTFSKRKEQQRMRLEMDCPMPLSPLLYGTLQKDKSTLSQETVTRCEVALSMEGSSPSRTIHCIKALQNAFTQLQSFYSSELNRLNEEIEEDEGRRKSLSEELGKTRESKEKSEWLLHKVNRLAEDKRHSRNIKVKSSSLSDLRASIVGSKTIPTMEPAVEKELQSLMGTIQVELKAVVGFARVATGDVFEVSIRHGNQKWKAKGKTTVDRNQKWDKQQTTFQCLPLAGIDVKVSEGGIFKSRVLSERAFDPCELLSPQSQLVTLNLNSIGSIKLQIVVTWIPPISSLPSHLPSISLSSSSSDNSDSISRRPRVLLREKKRGAAARMRNEWRSSTNILDDLYSDICKSIPTMDEMSSSRGTISSSTTKSPLPSMNNRRSLSLAYLNQREESFSSTPSTPNTNHLHRESRVLISQLISLSSSLRKQSAEAERMEVLLRRWQKGLDRKGQCRPFSTIDDLDDNVLVSSEDDSGVDSLRGTQGMGYRENDRRIRRKSGGEGSHLDGETLTVLLYHLRRVHNALTQLSLLHPSPLVYRSSQLDRSLHSECTSLNDLLILTSESFPNLSNLLVQLEADPEVHEIWLSTAFPLRASLLAPLDLLKEQLLSRVSLIVAPLYPMLAPLVSTAILDLLNDSVQERNVKETTVFHFVSLFRERPFIPFVENLSHENWMISLISSGNPDSILQVVERLRLIPLAPPLETLSSIASLLSTTQDSAIIDCIEEYLRSSRRQRRVDLLSSFLCLLESPIEEVRLGSLAVLAVLRNDRITDHLREVRDNDSSSSVRKEAERILESFSETTRI